MYINHSYNPNAMKGKKDVKDEFDDIEPIADDIHSSTRTREELSTICTKASWTAQARSTFSRTKEVRSPQGAPKTAVVKTLNTKNTPQGVFFCI